jgi:flagellin-like protein
MHNLLFQEIKLISGIMRKGLSPLVATVMLIAITLGVSALLGSWFTSTIKIETEIIGESATRQINCTSALLDIVDVICSSTNQSLKIALTNMGSIELYNFSTLVKINNTFYNNNTGGPDSTNPLDPGEQTILIYYCSNSICTANKTVEKVRISPYNCPQAWTETNVGKTCS